MKKFVVLTLVLAMASLATAGITIVGAPATMEPSDVVTLQLVGSDGELGTPAVISVMGPGVITPISNLVYPELPIEATAIELIPGVGYLFDLLIPDPINTLDGVVAEFSFHCEGEGEVIIMAGMDVFDATFDSVVIQQIPEPMTMALLGLGGLFLRRKK